MNRKAMLEYYAKNGTLTALRYLRKLTNNDENFFIKNFFLSARNEIIEWSYHELVPLKSHKILSLWCLGAANAGLLGLLQTYRAMTGLPPPNESCDYAALGGHLEVLKWLQGIGCTFNSNTCANAAEGGKLEVLKWLHEQNTDWDAITCYAAAERGHLEVLQWAIENGCEWDMDEYASFGGRPDVLKWAREKGYY